MVQPPVSSEEQHDDRDADPCPPEAEECFDAPDAASMEEAISKFVEGCMNRPPLPVSTWLPQPTWRAGSPLSPYGCADAVAADGRRGSNVYEVNLWLWSFARGKPRLGGLSVEQTFERQVAANEASKERAAENRRRRKADKA